MASKRHLEDALDDVHQNKKQKCIEDPPKSPTQKHRLDEDLGDHESKKRKFDVNPLLLTQQPMEILLEVLDSMKWDGSMVPLSGTCQLFNEICTPRLLLRLDFDRIFTEGAYPQLQRAYTALQLDGSQIDNRRGLLKACLENSRESVTNLMIGRDDGYEFETKMTLRTLLTMLHFFPKLNEVHMISVKAFSPPIKFTAIKDSEITLRQLKVLHLHSVSKNVLPAFKKVIGLEEFGISYVPSRLRAAVRKFITAQRGLKLLQADVFRLTPFRIMPKLTEIHASFRNIDYYENLTNPCLKFAPNLKRIFIISAHRVVNQENWQIGPIPTLKYIEINGRTGKKFNIQEILPRYPLLKSFKSFNYEWYKINV